MMFFKIFTTHFPLLNSVSIIYYWNIWAFCIVIDVKFIFISWEFNLKIGFLSASLVTQFWQKNSPLANWCKSKLLTMGCENLLETNGRKVWICREIEKTISNINPTYFSRTSLFNGFSECNLVWHFSD